MECPICSHSGSSDEIFMHILIHHRCDAEDHNITGKPCSNAKYVKCICVKCGLICESVESFLEHLITHRCSTCSNIDCQCMSIDSTENMSEIQRGDGVTNQIRPKSHDTNSFKLTDNSSSAAPIEGSLIYKAELEQPPVSEDVRETVKAMRNNKCHKCRMKFTDRNQLFHHIVQTHQELVQHEEVSRPPKEDFTLNTRILKDGGYIEVKADLKNRIFRNIDELFYQLKDQVFEKMLQVLKKEINYRVQFNANAVMVKESVDTRTVEQFGLNSFSHFVENEHAIQHLYNIARDSFKVTVEDFISNGSGWHFDGITDFSLTFLNMGKFYGGNDIGLPVWLSKKTQSILNVPGKDGMCFKRCIIAYFRKKHEKKVSGKQWKRKMYQLSYYKKHGRGFKMAKFDGLKFPFGINQVAQFHKLNPDIGLNIFCYNQHVDCMKTIEPTVDHNPDDDVDSDEEEEEILNPKVRKKSEQVRYEMIRKHTYPLSICREERKYIINLLLVQNGPNSHFCLIYNLLGFIRNPKHGYVKGICPYCLHSFGKSFPRHVKNCAMLGKMQTNFPKEKFLQFRDCQYMIKAPFIVAGDFECGLYPINSERGKMKLINMHKPTGYCWVCIDHLGNIVDSRSYVAYEEGENVGERMLKDLSELYDKLKGKINIYEENAYIQAKQALADHKLEDIKASEEIHECGFCLHPIDNKELVRHHSHLPDENGEYKFEFLAHNSCNLKARVSKKLPIFIHNLAGYDSHIILRAAQNKEIVKTLEVIGSSAEKFSAIDINKNLLFRDSLSFFHTSLDSYSKTLDQQNDFKTTEKFFSQERGYSMDKIQLLKRKGVYPYQYFDSISKYNETKLPPKDSFKSDLNNGKGISDEDYEYAQKVWNDFGIRDLREYTRIYCEADVLLLLDCFERMRSISMHDYKLDPAQFYSAAQLSWTACLRYTKCKLEYVRDDVHIYFELACRGGVSVGGSRRFFQANNPYVATPEKPFDPCKPTSYCINVDCNNLYPNALSTPNPIGDFEFIRGRKLKEIKRRGREYIDSIADDGDEGCYITCDLSFPKETHKLFQGLPPVPYKRTVEYDELSPRQRQYAKELGISNNCMKSQRLITDLLPRRRYRVHYRVLKFYLSIGVKLDAIRQVLRFKQKPVFEPYLSDLAKKRQAATTKVEQNWYKLAGNVIFGKSCEDVRKRMNYKIIRSREDALLYNSKPTVSRVIIVDGVDESEEPIVIVCLKKLSVTLNKPIYIGATCLDESKRILYEFYYKFCIPMWGDRMVTIGSDTDSLFLGVETENIYDDMKANEKEWFDFSNFPKGSEIWGKYHSDYNKRVLGKFKDESAGNPISSFIYLQPKVYCYQVVVLDEETGLSQFQDVKRAKGVPRNALQTQCPHEYFLNCLNGPALYNTASTRILSIGHKLYTIEQLKRSLCGFDIKRYIYNCGIITVPYGYMFIPDSELAPKLDAMDVDC